MGGGGGFQKITLMRGGGLRKKTEIGGGHTIFKLHSSKSHQPPLPHKKWTVPQIVECGAKYESQGGKKQEGERREVLQAFIFAITP